MNDQSKSSGMMDDPVLTAVLANRLDGIVREMTNTLLRAARSEPRVRFHPRDGAGQASR